PPVGRTSRRDASTADHPHAGERAMSARAAGTVLHVVVALALGACGSQATLPSNPTIEDLRAHAEQNPRDPDAQRELALAELLMEGGDAARVEAQVARALALAPDDERLLFAAGVERSLHGHPAEALSRYLDAVEAARRSPRSG